VNASGLSVEDRNSSNGTRVNGQRLTPFAPHPLKPGDTLEVGEVRLQVRQT
jgi:pSer/pThr/pTyr-binding forkhead associated (FHA) protein